MNEIANEVIIGKCEIDNHADTTCLGVNFVPLFYTQQECTVAPFSQTYQPIERVPIVTGATAYDDAQTGQVFLLIFHQSLFFGDQLDHSLINPNQCRSYGIKVTDNPWDLDPIGLTCKDLDFHIPFQYSHNVISFKT